jgi:hypothetical protein
MTSIFNRMLVCLSAFDNLFIVCSIFEAVRKNFRPVDEAIQGPMLSISMSDKNLSDKCQVFDTFPPKKQLI